MLVVHACDHTYSHAEGSALVLLRLVEPSERPISLHCDSLTGSTPEPWQGHRKGLLTRVALVTVTNSDP